MKDLETIAKLHSLVKAAGEPVSVTFSFAMLAEMVRMVEICESYEDNSPEAIMQSYIFIADEYMLLRHFLLAKQNYDKALALLENYPEIPQRDGLVDWCKKKLGKIENKEDESFTKCDPVE